MAAREDLSKMTMQERRARNRRIAEECRAAVADAKEALRKGEELRTQLDVTYEQAAAYVEERAAIAAEKAAIHGEAHVKTRRVRTRI